MDFIVLNNDENETPYPLAPGEIFLFSQFGQLLLINENDNSITSFEKKGDYVIVFENNVTVFENNEASLLEDTIRFVY